jgi:hypothetical protein
MNTSVHYSEQRSPECQPLPEMDRFRSSGEIAARIRKPNRQEVRCPFCGSHWTVGELMQDATELYPFEASNETYGPGGAPCTIGGEYQCVCGAWFYEGMPDD